MNPQIYKASLDLNIKLLNKDTEHCLISTEHLMPNYNQQIIYNIKKDFILNIQDDAIPHDRVANLDTFIQAIDQLQPQLREQLFQSFRQDKRLMDSLSHLATIEESTLQRNAAIHNLLQIFQASPQSDKEQVTPNSP